MSAINYGDYAYSVNYGYTHIYGYTDDYQQIHFNYTYSFYYFSKYRVDYQYGSTYYRSQPTSDSISLGADSYGVFYSTYNGTYAYVDTSYVSFEFRPRRDYSSHFSVNYYYNSTYYLTGYSGAYRYVYGVYHTKHTVYDISGYYARLNYYHYGNYLSLRYYTPAGGSYTYEYSKIN